MQPHLPVSEYRTEIHGIPQQALQQVPFTLRHAQAAMLRLCCDRTIVVGHAVHNDMAALKFAHTRVVDTALLHVLRPRPDATPALRDVASAAGLPEMPEPHDSVIDARAAYAGAARLCEAVGDADEYRRRAVIERLPPSKMQLERRRGRSPQKQQLLERKRREDPKSLMVHRIPKTCEPGHLRNMFAKYTGVAPGAVDAINFGANGQGKTFVAFADAAEADRAFDALTGSVEKDASGHDQKRIFLAGGGYIKVRKLKG